MGLKSYVFASLHQPVCERSNVLQTQVALNSGCQLAFFEVLPCHDKEHLQKRVGGCVGSGEI